jgi:hypothetical protein
LAAIEVLLLLDGLVEIVAEEEVAVKGVIEGRGDAEAAFTCVRTYAVEGGAGAECTLLLAPLGRVLLLLWELLILLVVELAAAAWREGSEPERGPIPIRRLNRSNCVSLTDFGDFEYIII